jgi:anaerobic selenocysteine-containing dehydrogenase
MSDGQQAGIEGATSHQHATFCRLCEAYCGLVATVEGHKVVAIKPDFANPHSEGHVCVKGMAIGEIANDPDRLLLPMKRVGGPGEFLPVSWDEALSDIAERLGRILERDGGEALGLVHGNPVGFATDFVVGVGAFLGAFGANKRWHAGSQDHSSRLAANYFVYGDPERNAFPDLVNCDFLMVMGANPLVSNGSLLFAPRLRHDLDAIAKRGRVVVVDPRATETAKRYEHLPIVPTGDLWMLLAMLRVVIEDGLADHDFIAANTLHWDDLQRAVLSVPLAEATRRCGVPVETIRELATAFATTERAAIYGRLGLCRGPFGTFTNFVLTALNIVAGKFGRRGCTIFGYDVFAGMDVGQEKPYVTGKSRIGDAPAVSGAHASAMLPADLLEQGPGRLRALLVVGGNPVLSAPGGAKLVEGLEQLELMVAHDLYMNETNRYAHYLLPGATFLERADIPLYGLTFSLMRPFIQYTDAVVPPPGEARDEFDLLAEIAARLGKDIVGEGKPLAMFDAMLRNGPAGDAFSERDGWSFAKLRGHPHGVMVDLPDPTEAWQRKVGFADRKLRLWDAEFDTELAKARSLAAAPRGSLRLIGRRDIRSMNSWMHNVEKLTRSQKPALLVNPIDAQDRQIADGDTVRVWTDFGQVAVSAAVTDEVMPGVVCYPHGWGHHGGWRVANRTVGQNINVLLPFGEGTTERLAGMTFIDGLPVQVERLVTQ